jgi:NADH-quinone oxidoreductase subunit J
MSALLFVVFAGLAMGGAAFIAATKKLVHAAFALFAVLLAMAALFVLAGSGFLAAAQVIVYVGGILILLLFGVMLSGRTQLPGAAEAGVPFTGIINRIPAAVACLALLFILLFSFKPTTFDKPGTASLPQDEVKTIGLQTLTQYLIPFEVAGIILLLALVGAAYISRRNPPQPRNTIHPQ